MNVEDYIRQKQERCLLQNKFRETCAACLMPPQICYCAHVQPIDPLIKFVILIHPLEIRRKIATGRMSHLSLKNSELLRGQEFTQNERLNDLLENPDYEPIVLFPGPQSLNLTTATAEQRSNVFIHKQRIPLIIVADGTWSTAKKTVRRSLNLVNLPRICFTPTTLSQFKVRKQPKPECVSTIEAIHQTIELLGPAVGFDTSSRHHDSLLNTFDKMVEQQLRFIKHARLRPSRYAQARSQSAS
jgi:DTW domain-containing protein